MKGSAPTSKETKMVFSELRAIGLDAQISERSRPEKYVGKPRTSTQLWGTSSLGLVEIQNSPIRLVNVLREVEFFGYGGKRNTYRITCIVPDSKIFRKERLKSVQVKSVASYIKQFFLLPTSRTSIIGIRWKGNAKASLISRLNQDVLLSRFLIDLKEDMEIRSYPRYKCWAIETGTRSPSREKWNCYETIARYLLESAVN